MKYRTIVIDPPWDIHLNESSGTHGEQPKELPYGTMSDNALHNFPINRFADEQCDLFLWTTKSKLHTAFHILVSWGFHFNNLMIWNKRDGFNNNGFHLTLEFVLYAYKGKNGLPFDRPLETYFEAKRIKHSQKPDKFYALIRDRTQAPRIDIFARKRHYGFDAWGDQVESTMQIPLTF